MEDTNHRVERTFLISIIRRLKINCEYIKPKIAWPVHRRADLAPQAGSVDVEGLRKELRKISDQTENSGGWHFVDKIIDHLASRNLLAGAPVGGDRPAIPGLQEAQGWQTVENVPRDQDVLVGYLNHAGEVEDVSVAYVSEGEKYHINSIYAEPRGDCRHCGGACKRVYVTHWMPLPAAPRDGRG